MSRIKKDTVLGGGKKRAEESRRGGSISERQESGEISAADGEIT